jgi:hypothetical protein
LLGELKPIGQASVCAPVHAEGLGGHAVTDCTGTAQLDVKFLGFPKLAIRSPLLLRFICQLAAMQIFHSVLRHTALTHLAESGCDVFTLARIAGHSSITITQQYVHPQADAIERAFQQTAKPVIGALPKVAK